MEDEENQIVEENESANADYLSSAANGVQDPFFLPHPAVPNVPGFPNFFQGVVQVGCKLPVKESGEIHNHLVSKQSERRDNGL